MGSGVQHGDGVLWGAVCNTCNTQEAVFNTNVSPLGSGVLCKMPPASTVSVTETLLCWACNMSCMPASELKSAGVSLVILGPR